MQQNNEMQANALQRFFEENSNVCIRAQVINGEPWFVAKDIAMMLGLKWHHNFLLSIPEEWKGRISIPTLSSGGRGGGVQCLLVVNSCGVYKMIFRSRKPEADRIVNWLAGEVMPSLLHTGIYAVDGSLVRNGVEGVYYKGEKLWPYREMLAAIGYSRRSGSVDRRRKQYPDQFVRAFGRTFIKAELISVLEDSKRVESRRIALIGMQQKLPFQQEAHKTGKED